MYSGPRSKPARQAQRDSQKQRVYNAEGALPSGQALPTVPQMQSYVDKLLRSAWARRRWGNRSITVNPGFGHRRATGGYGVVQMPNWARNERTLLHEVAHNLAGVNARHGPVFMRIALELYEHVFSKDDVAKLREAMRKERVRVGPALKLRASVPDAPAPAPTRKLFRVEVKRRGGQVSTRDINAISIAHAIDLLLLSQPDTVTQVRVWRGRPTAVAAKKRS